MSYSKKSFEYKKTLEAQGGEVRFVPEKELGGTLMRQ